ncbi:MAG: tRNA (adenosine(37)-N6)-threonylcarbamoyltransferase complex dimerization subunit type 1 TsaB [Clostridia bacterium]|nr:tRNA (adenosine(37)-N6)-threonylcarbamoyltransferase complex dimerization subunit type 1 TsaB [Clostridia bacterium]
MKILSVDSSATVASVALCENGRLLAEYTLNNKNTHSETLLPMIESLISFFSMEVGDVDLFAVSTGPGSFTGVRIGTATVKGLAFASDKPCVGVSTLEAIAYNLRFHKGIVCPVMNARRSQVYTAIFRSDGEKLERLTEDLAISISELDGMLAEYDEETVLAGDGYDICVGVFEKTTVRPVPERLRHQSAFSVAEAALAAYESGRYCSDAELGVEYLRPSQAERERAEREAANK